MRPTELKRYRELLTISLLTHTYLIRLQYNSTLNILEYKTFYFTFFAKHFPIFFQNHKSATVAKR